MYASLEELEASFSTRTLVQLSNDDATATKPNNAILTQALTIATERIDLSLRARYVLPLTKPCTLLNAYCLSLARYWLYNRRLEKMPESVKDAYKDTLNELSQIAQGKLHLGLKEVSAGQDDLLPETASIKVNAPNTINTRGY